VKQPPAQITPDQISEIESCAHRLRKDWPPMSRGRTYEDNPPTREELSDEGKALWFYLFDLLGHIRHLEQLPATPVLMPNVRRHSSRCDVF
jgi:hypothetical protein